jgi:hypothetical protein
VFHGQSLKPWHAAAFFLWIVVIHFCRHGRCLRTGDCDDDVKQAIANKIIELAKTGERHPDLLCEHALEYIRKPQV